MTAHGAGLIPCSRLRLPFLPSPERENGGKNQWPPHSVLSLAVCPAAAFLFSKPAFNTALGTPGLPPWGHWLLPWQRYSRSGRKRRKPDTEKVLAHVCCST
jgi:hypothetical protein